MKKFKLTTLSVFLILLPAMTILGQNDWVWQNPLPQGSSMKGVKMLDANSVIAVGDVSTIIKTTDGGTNWNLHHHIDNTDFTFTSLYFLNSTTGWAAQGYTVYKTTDAGETWTPDSVNQQIS